MRTQPRERRQISASKLRWLNPLLRYSYNRDAYVLRVIGGQVGPVYRLQADEPPPRRETPRGQARRSLNDEPAA